MSDKRKKQISPKFDVHKIGTGNPEKSRKRLRVEIAIRGIAANRYVITIIKNFLPIIPTR